MACFVQIMKFLIPHQNKIVTDNNMSFITGISRFILPLLTLIILVKCLLTLLLGQPREKTYGYIIDEAKNKRYPLNMWETSIGRSSSCDIIVSYATISRFHAVISRRIDGWYIYDLNSKSGIRINGTKVEKKATISAGDELDFGGVKYYFQIINDPVQKVGKKKKGKKIQQPVKTRPVPQPIKPVRTVYDRDILPPENDLFRDEHQRTGHYNSGDFYNSQHKPDLHFRKNEPETDFISERNIKKDIYSGSSHIQTPSSENSFLNRRIVFSRPAIINRDTNETFILSGNLVSIGRHRGCDIHVDSPTASRRHALLILYEDGWVIDDAGSTSGTFLNGKKVTEPQLLFDGDIIAVGDNRLYFTTGRNN